MGPANHNLKIVGGASDGLVPIGGSTERDMSGKAVILPGPSKLAIRISCRNLNRGQHHDSRQARKRLDSLDDLPPPSPQSKRGRAQEEGDV
jgi:hypothetical protein